MRIYIFLFSLVGLVNLAAGGRIIGGEKVAITDYPHQAGLFRRQFYNDQFQCGAIIISPRHVLTAAHCRRGPPDQYTVVIGQSEVPDFADLNHRLSYKVKDFVLHPDFNTKTAPVFDNDIAILTIDGELELDGEFARAVEFAPQPAAPGSMAEVSGYGNTERNLIPRPRSGRSKVRPLKAAYVPIVAHSSCDKYFKEHHPKYHITENMICAGHPCQDDACQGDSGGPLVDENGQLVGLVSYGKGCGSYDPGVYTSVHQFKDFIRQETCGLVEL